jgi:hypothetical protein
MKNRVRAVLRNRKATNRPPRACRHTLDIIAEHADFSTGRNAYPAKPYIAERTGHSKREIQRHVARLRGGGWLALQEKPDEHARESYEAIRGDQRPLLYYVVLPTFTCSRPGPLLQLRGDILTTRDWVRRGDILTPPRGDIFAPDGVTPVPPNHPMTSETSSLRSTDSLRNESLPKKHNPPRAGGSDSGTSESSSRPAPASQTELRRTVRVALKILEKPLAILSTEASWSAVTALETVTTRWRCCLRCALLVPYWVAHGCPPHGKNDVLEGLNQRTNLSYLWGPAWGDLMGTATQDELLKDDDGRRSEFENEVEDLVSREPGADVYDDARPVEDYDAIRTACRWCPR